MKTKTYKVWIEIEEYNNKTDEGTPLDAPGAAIAVFDTYEEAWAFAEALSAVKVFTRSRSKRKGQR